MSLSVAENLFFEKKYKKCFLNLIQVSQKLSHSLDYLELLFKVQMCLKDPVAAIKTLDVLMAKTERSFYALQKMDILLSLGHHNEALDIALDQQTKNLTLSEQQQLFNNLIDIYIVFNDFEGIQETLNTYHESFSSEAMYSFAQGILHIHADQSENAIQCLREAVCINPKLDRAWVSLAIMHNKMGDTELALANIEKALDINPQNPVAVKCFAIWKEQIGDYEQAYNKIDGYLQINNFDQELIKKEIDLLRKLGREEVAFSEETKLTYYFGQI